MEFIAVGAILLGVVAALAIWKGTPISAVWKNEKGEFSFHVGGKKDH